MSSGNGDGPFRSSRTAPEWLPCGVEMAGRIPAGGLHRLPLASKPVSQGWLCHRVYDSPIIRLCGDLSSRGFQKSPLKACIRQVSSSVGKGGSSASGAGAPPICISCHWARVISSCLGLEPSKGPTMPRSSIWSTRRAARE